eukprot:3678166-Amphidinium_carterae.1
MTSAEVTAACAVFCDKELYPMPRSSPCHAATCAQTSIKRKQDQTATMYCCIRNHYLMNCPQKKNGKVIEYPRKNIT